jgi:RNA polymerase sigma factor (sigma-70 family)
MKTATSPILQLIRRAVQNERAKQLTDGQLLDRFQSQRDEGAFHALVRRHGSMVLDVSRNVLRNEADTEDVFQATFLVLAQKAGTIRKMASIGSWLYGVAYRTALKTQRDGARRHKHETHVSGRSRSGRADDLAWREVQQVLHQELTKISEYYRAPLALCYLQGKTQDEAATLLGISKASVKKRLERGRALLRTRLVRRGLGSAGLCAAAAWPAASVSAQPPSTLISGAVQAAMLATASPAPVGGMIAAKVVTLSQEVAKPMFLIKMKSAAVALLVVVLACSGTGMLSYHLLAAKPPGEIADAPRSRARAALVVAWVPDDDKPAKPDRAALLKAIREEYQKARTEFGQAIRAGTIKPDADGDYPGWSDLLKRYTKRAHQLIDANPADAVGLEALVFCLDDLGAGDAEPGLYQLVLKHHPGSEKIDTLLRLRSAPTDFLQGVAAQSPQAKIRLWANYHLAESLYRDGKPKEAEPLLEVLEHDAQAKDLGGYMIGTLADTARHLLFEVRRLNIGQEAPDITGVDLDNQALKLSASRGKVTLLVFWATWCGPCMAMVPHERALATRYAGKPFVIVGVNGDTLPMKDFQLTGPDGKPIDDTQRVKAALEKHQITWRSFRSGQFGIAADWNVRSWPTVYLIDRLGVIQGKWKGDPGEKKLDAAIEKLMQDRGE